MRARTPVPAVSFQAQLAAYREGLLKDTLNWNGRELITRALDNWRDHPEAEKIWRKITAALVANKAPPLPASLFIATLLRMRVECERLRAWTERLRPGIKPLPGTEPLRLGTSHAQALITELEKQAKSEWRSGDASLAVSAAAKRIAAEIAESDLTAVLGHKKLKAPQKRFMATLREWFVANCGKPMKPIVANLTGIFFDDENVDIQHVKDALKPTRGDIRRKKQARMSPKKGRTRG